MRRGGSLRRNTPLEARAPLRRSGGGLGRSTFKRTPARVERRHPADDEPTWAEAVRAVRARSGGRCEVGIVRGCTGRHEHTHHRRLRSQGGTHHPYNLLGICRPCHDAAHAYPDRSYRAGILVRSTENPCDRPLDSMSWGMAS